MNLIPPSSQCPPERCFEVVQICWTDGQSQLTACSVVPADLLVRNSVTVSLGEIVVISTSMALMMATAWLFRYVANFIHYSR